MAWFYRAIEREDGRWTCRHGLSEYDSHDTVEASLEHLRELAAPAGDFTLFVHPLDGTAVRPAVALTRPTMVRLLARPTARLDAGTSSGNGSTQL
ncbi:MAG: hypothetical protein ACJ74U_13900 [Jatrophihabitantaceae bacterium]